MIAPMIPETLRICARCCQDLALQGRTECLVCILSGWVPLDVAEDLVREHQPSCPCGCGLPECVVAAMCVPPERESFWERLPQVTPRATVTGAHHLRAMRWMAWACLGCLVLGLCFGRFA
jgi:hypothetical protein